MNYIFPESVLNNEAYGGFYNKFTNFYIIPKPDETTIPSKKQKTMGGKKTRFKKRSKHKTKNKYNKNKKIKKTIKHKKRAKFTRNRQNKSKNKNKSNISKVLKLKRVKNSLKNKNKKNIINISLKKIKI